MAVIEKARGKGKGKGAVVGNLTIDLETGAFTKDSSTSRKRGHTVRKAPPKLSPVEAALKNEIDRFDKASRAAQKSEYDADTLIKDVLFYGKYSDINIPRNEWAKILKQAAKLRGPTRGLLPFDLLEDEPSQDRAALFLEGKYKTKNEWRYLESRIQRIGTELGYVSKAPQDEFQLWTGRYENGSSVRPKEILRDLVEVLDLCHKENLPESISDAALRKIVQIIQGSALVRHWSYHLEDLGHPASCTMSGEGNAERQHISTYESQNFSKIFGAALAKQLRRKKFPAASVLRAIVKEARAGRIAQEPKEGENYAPFAKER